MIASMYENNVLQIKTGSVMLSEKFLGYCRCEAETFLIYIIDAFNEELCGPIKLGPTSVNCLLYAEDIILLSESENG